MGASLGGFKESNTQIEQAVRSLKNETELFKYFRNFTNTVFLTTPTGIELGTSTFLFEDKDTSILPGYKTLITKVFKADTRILDFKDTQETTNLANKDIQNVFPTISNVFHTDDFVETSFIMSNVIHFRGFLSTPFNVSDTVEEIIYNDNNEVIGSVQMMYQKGKLPYSDFESMNSHILELPYDNDGKFCMLVIFPYPHIKPSDVYKKLEKISFRNIFMKIENDLNKKGLEDVIVKMPRFSIRGSYTLKNPLQKMGVYYAFEPNYARFDRISLEDLYITAVEHKAHIMFGETETVAFATTPGYFDDQKTPFIKAEQPFLFFLMEKPTASILFGGIYSRHRIRSRN